MSSSPKNELDDEFDDFQEPEIDSPDKNNAQDQLNQKIGQELDQKADSIKDIDDKYELDADLHLPNEPQGYDQPNGNSSNNDSQEECKDDDSFDDFWEAEQVPPQIDSNQTDEEHLNNNTDNWNEGEKSDQITVPQLNEENEPEAGNNLNVPNQQSLDSESDDIQIKADDSSDEPAPHLALESNTNDVDEAQPEIEESKNQPDDQDKDEFDDFEDPQPVEESQNNEAINQQNEWTENADNNITQKLEANQVANDIQIEPEINSNDDSFNDFEQPISSIPDSDIPKQENINKPDEIELKADDDSFDDFAQPVDNNQIEVAVEVDVLPTNQIDHNNKSFEEFEEPVNAQNNETEAKENNNNPDEIELKADDDSFDDFAEPASNQPESEENKESEKVDRTNDQQINEPNWDSEVNNEQPETDQAKQDEIELKADSDSFDDFAAPETTQQVEEGKDEKEVKEDTIEKATEEDNKDDSFDGFEEPVDLSANVLPNQHTDQNQLKPDPYLENNEVELEQIVIQQPDQVEGKSEAKAEDGDQGESNAKNEESFEEFASPDVVQPKVPVNDDDSFDDFADPNEAESQPQENKPEAKESSSNEIEENNQELNLPSNRSQEEYKQQIKDNSDSSDDAEIKPDDDSFEDFEEPVVSNPAEKQVPNTQNDSFEDFADPNEDKIDSVKPDENNKPKKAESQNSSESDKIEMKEDDDSFDDFADPDSNNQVTGSSEQPASDQLRIPENYQETSSRSEGIDLKEDSFDDFAEPEGNKTDKNTEEDKKESEVEHQKDDSDFDDFNDPEEKQIAIDKPVESEEIQVEKLQPQEKTTAVSSPISSPSPTKISLNKGMFSESLDEFSHSETYLSCNSSSKSSLSDIWKRLAKSSIILNLKEVSSKYESLIDQEVGGYSSRNIPSFTTTYSVKDLFERYQNL